MHFRRSNAALALLAVAATTTLVACTPPKRKVSTAPTTTSVTTVDETITRSVTETPSQTPAPTTTGSPPTGAITQHGVTEKTGVCPYLSFDQAQDINGSRVRRHTIITTDPVGCMFYALNPTMYKQVGKAGRPTVGITTARYRSAADAEQGMVKQALKGGHHFSTTVDGHQGALFRTKFNPTDGDQDWACAFVVGKVVVTVKTDRFDQYLPALNLATTIEPKF